MPAGSDQDRCVKGCPTLKMKSIVFSEVYFLQNLDTNYSFVYLLSLIICERIGKIIARMLCFMHQSFFRPNYILNKASQAIQSPRTVPFFLLVSLLDGYSFPNVLVKGIVAFKH